VVTKKDTTNEIPLGDVTKSDLDVESKTDVKAVESEEEDGSDGAKDEKNA